MFFLKAPAYVKELARMHFKGSTTSQFTVSTLQKLCLVDFHHYLTVGQPKSIVSSIREYLKLSEDLLSIHSSPPYQDGLALCGVGAHPSPSKRAGGAVTSTDGTTSSNTHTELALRELYQQVSSMPESAKKKKLIRQVGHTHAYTCICIMCRNNECLAKRVAGSLAVKSVGPVTERSLGQFPEPTR